MNILPNSGAYSEVLCSSFIFSYFPLSAFELLQVNKAVLYVDTIRTLIGVCFTPVACKVHLSMANCGFHDLHGLDGASQIFKSVSIFDMILFSY